MPFNFTPHRQAVEFGRVDEKIFNNLSEDASIIEDTIADLSRDPDSHKSKHLDRSHVESIQFDTFNALSKYAPKVKDSTDPLINEIMGRMMRDDQYANLRASTVGDDLAAAVGSCGLTREVITNLPADVKDAANDHSKAQEEAKEAQAQADALKAGLEDGDDEIDADEVRELQEFAASKQDQAQKAAQRLSRALSDHGKSIGKIVAQAVSKAGDQAQAVATASNAFGLSNGAVSGGLPIEEKFRLAKIIQSQGKRFVDLVNLIGRMQATAQRKQAEKMQHDGGEIVDIIQGDDIGLLIDEEVALLNHPIIGKLQRARLMDADLAQFEVETREPKAKGDIVILLDESGSMKGTRDAEAKAITLAIAHLAMKQKRKLIVHFFQYSVTHTVILDGTDSTAKGLEVAMRGLGSIASRGTGGGTNFDAPLRTALDSSKALREPDIIAITDGEATISPDTLKIIGDQKKANGLNIFAMLIGGSNSNSVAQFADRVWCADSLLNKAAPELFEIL